jgi:hypothetical protein
MGEKLMSDVLKRLFVGANIECGQGVSCTINRISITPGYYSNVCYVIRYSRNGTEFELIVELYQIGKVVVTYHKLNDDPISNDLDLLNAMRLNTFNSDEDKYLFFEDGVARSVLTSPWGLVSLLIWNDRLNMNRGLDEGFKMFPQYVCGYSPAEAGTRKPLPRDYVYGLGDYTFSLEKNYVKFSDMVVHSVDMYQNVCYIGYSGFHTPCSLKLVRRGESIFSSCWYAQQKDITSLDQFLSLLALNEKMPL